MASDFFRPRPVAGFPAFPRKDSLPRRPRGCLLNLAQAAMNDSKATSSKQGASTETLIYVVDDEPMLLDLTSVILEPLGYLVESFDTPESALHRFKVAHPKPDLVITDYAMRSMTGLQLATACRQICPSQKILLISGTAGEDVLCDGPVQPDGFLAKPYQTQEFIDAVKAALKT